MPVKRATLVLLVVFVLGLLAWSGPASGHEPGEEDHDMEVMEHPSMRTNNPVVHFFFWVGKFHPPTVNFPVALFCAAAVAELMLMTTGNATYDAAARYCVIFGTLTAVAAVFMGWLFEGFTLHVDSWILNVHRWLGTSMGVWAVLVLLLSEFARRGPRASRTWPIYRLALFIGAGLVIATGFFGGAMVYGIHHYGWR